MGVLKKYQGDIIGGAVVSIVALPLAIAFGIQSMNGDPAGAIAGLYGAIFAGIFSTLFGGTPGLINGPTGAMIVVLSGIFAKYGNHTFFTAMFFASSFQILFGILNIGRFIRMIPKPVIVGFTNGIGILIFLKQISDFKNGPIIALIIIGLMVLLPRISITKKIPASLVALIVGTVIAQKFFPNILYVGEIPSGVPMPHLPLWSQINWHAAVIGGLAMALLASIETLLSGLIVEDMTANKCETNKELIGQGIGNGIAVLFGGLIGTGAIVRSAVNINNGGRTKLSGVLHGLLILLITVKFSTLAALIPKAALAGILMVTAINMIEFESVKIIHRLPKSDAVVMVLTTILTISLDLTKAVAIGTITALLLFAYKMSEIHFEQRKVIGLFNKEQNIFIHRLIGPIFFGSVDKVMKIIKEQEQSIVILDFTEVPIIDETGAELIRKYYEKLNKKSSVLLIVGLQAKPCLVLQKLGIISQIGENFVFNNLPEAKQFIREVLEIEIIKREDWVYC